MSLPNGYKMLEYLQSTGTQYIVTGLNSTNRYDHEIVFSDYVYVSGQGILGSSNAYYTYIGYNNTLRWCMADRCYDTPGSLTSKRTVKLGYNYLTVDGSSVSEKSDTNVTPSDTTHTLFKGSKCASVKIYSYRASLDGQLLRDFVPCKRNSDNELGMYDLVNNVFYTNAGTGTFKAGPVIAISAALSDITQLEYIKSSGKQYINTGFPPNQSTRVVCDTVFAATSAGAWLFGARHGNTDRTFGFLTYQNSYRSDFNTSTNETITETQSGRFTVDKDGNITKINGITVKTAAVGTFQCSHSLFLFANNNNGTVGGYGTATVYSCKIYDNGTLVRDYIAAKLSDGTAGMYDKLHGLFYVNLGTGTFTAGPVVMPDSPANLKQTMAVRLAWSAMDFATVYNVYRDGTLLGSTPDTSFVDTTAEENQEYVYGVSSANSAGESSKTTITVYTKSGYFLYKPYIESATFQ